MEFNSDFIFNDKMLDSVKNVLISGVDFVNFPDTGGEKCLSFISYRRRVIETFVSFVIFLAAIIVGFQVK